MTSKVLCRLVRVAVIAVAICGLAACIYALPTYGAGIAENNPDYAGRYIPWLVFLWMTAIPCFAFLVFIWMVSTAIKNDKLFTLQSARLFKIGAIVLFFDVGFFFIGNIVFVLLGMSNPGILLLSIIADVFGASLAVMVAILSRYLTKAAALQEEADSTI